MGRIGCADDIMLLSYSRHGIQRLVDICIDSAMNMEKLGHILQPTRNSVYYNFW